MGIGVGINDRRWNCRALPVQIFGIIPAERERKPNWTYTVRKMTSFLRKISGLYGKQFNCVYVIRIPAFIVVYCDPDSSKENASSNPNPFLGAVSNGGGPGPGPGSGSFILPSGVGIGIGGAVVKSEELAIVAIVLLLWMAAIALFINRWGKIRNGGRSKQDELDMHLSRLT